jgi:redox-sensing transcriptional repressor
VSGRPLPRATVARLPLYLQYLDHLAEGTAIAPSDDMAGEFGLNPATVRKDLWYLGAPGIRGIGYEVGPLRKTIESALGLTQVLPVVIVGAGHLGSAVAGYGGFARRGFRVRAIFDIDEAKVGTEIAGVLVRHADRLADEVALPECIGIVAVPETAAQEVADRLVARGVRSILNFAPTILRLPEGVESRHVDVVTELQILAFYLSAEATERPSAEAAG